LRGDGNGKNEPRWGAEREFQFFILIILFAVITFFLWKM